MANSLCFTFASIISSQSPIKPGILICSEPTKIRGIKPSGVKNAKSRIVETKATGTGSKDNQGKTKTNSIVCADCDGNGALQCSQCKGDGVNLVDHFNGQFKAGGLCWLCRGKREILCGSCNGAGFLGGFMSSFDE